MLKSSLIDDFKMFKTEPSEKMRAKIVVDICEQFNAKGFNAKQKEVVYEILSYLSRDIEKNIRKILSQNLKENPDLPHEVALRLANDIEEVSSPILEFSSVLNDEDLEQIIESCANVAKLSAIAKRKTLSSRVSMSLVATKSDKVVKTLITNKNVQISDKISEAILEAFKDSENILGLLISRGELKKDLADKMTWIVSEKLSEQLAEKYGISTNVAKRATEESFEQASVEMVGSDEGDSGTIQLVNHLKKTGKLNHSIVLKALCRFDLEFFETGMAKMANIPLMNASKLIRSADRKGFEALYKAAYMPSAMLEATEVLLKLILQNRIKEDDNEEEYSKNLIEDIISHGYDEKIPNMRYFLALIGSHAAECAGA